LLGHPLALLPQVQLCPVLMAPELDAGLLGGSQQSRAEGQNPPSPCAHAAGDAAQGTVGLLGCQCALPGHVDLLVNQHPQVLLLKAALRLCTCKGLSSFQLPSLYRIFTK